MKYIGNLLSIFDIKKYRPFDKFVFVFLLLGIVVFAYASLHNLSMKYSKETPKAGGVLKEGVIGAARFINPVLAVSDSDKDLAALIYSGLMKPDTNGGLEDDLAESFDISEDGKEYTFNLRKDAIFHDGSPVTAEDVAFTINLIQNPTIKSPERANWEDVEVQVMDKYTVKFVLPKPYAPFLENTTIGILPKHIWSSMKPEEMQFSFYNERPIGSGPFKMEEIRKDAQGIPNEYILIAFKEYVHGKPYIKRIIVKSYSNSADRLKAWQNNQIDAVSAVSGTELPFYAKDGMKIVKMGYPSVFAVFLNPKQGGILSDSNVRKALNTATNKDKIVAKVLKGYGKVAQSPIPPIFNVDSGEFKTETVDYYMKKAGYEKKDGYWMKKDKKASFTLSLTDSKEFADVADLLVDMWNKAGFDVRVKIYSFSDLSQKIIRERNYDALLFGEAPGRAIDLYAFWHSSQKDDPGLNISSYVSSKADKLLEKLRVEQDKDKRIEIMKDFEKEIQSDMPAIFLYTPDFLYLVPDNLKGNSMQLIAYPAERFTDIHKWYFNVDRVWKWFIN